MTDEKLTIERIRQLANGDPLNVRGDPELQLAAIEAAHVRYKETRTDIDLNNWAAVIAATIDLGTTVRVRTLSPSSGFENVTYPIGTEGVLVEMLGTNWLEWLVEVRIPDETLVGGASFDVFEIALTDLEPVP